MNRKTRPCSPKSPSMCAPSRRRPRRRACDDSDPPMSRTLALTEQLISRRSVTPDDAGCQALISERLAALGFACETLAYGPDQARVTNLWAVRRGCAGAAGKLLAFAGHTDVVPTGPLTQWTSDPFLPTHRAGQLYGRGAA